MPSEENFDKSRKKTPSAIAEAATARAQRMDRHVAERLRRRRQEIPLSTKELADLVSVPESYIIQYEDVEMGVPAALLVALAKALNCSPGYFLEGFHELM